MENKDNCINSFIFNNSQKSIIGNILNQSEHIVFIL